MAIQVMSEVGIDISGQPSIAYRSLMGRMAFEEAIVVCRRAEEFCPTLSADARRIERWVLDDPRHAEGTDEEKLAVFRAVRDTLDTRIKLWLKEAAEFERPGN